jgi:FKBP-type peptidyl-prolyl cis-trans isomerase 2
MIPALEKGILGLKIGSKKTIEIKAADAYGEYDTAALQEVPRNQFPNDLELKVGQAYRVQTPQGPLTVTITTLTAKGIRITDGPTKTSSGSRFIFIDAPDGYEVELIERPHGVKIV